MYNFYNSSIEEVEDKALPLVVLEQIGEVGSLEIAKFFCRKSGSSRNEKEVPLEII